MSELDEIPTLRRSELLGSLARACRLALEENEIADAVDIRVTATAQGMTLDVTLMAGEQPVSGWGI